jgi:hypothetical protein
LFFFRFESFDLNGQCQIEAPIQLHRLVEALRQCSMEELKQIDRAVASGRKDQQRDMQTDEKFLIDALAIAGTRNTIAALVEVSLCVFVGPYSPFVF